MFKQSENIAIACTDRVSSSRCHLPSMRGVTYAVCSNFILSVSARVYEQIRKVDELILLTCFENKNYRACKIPEILFALSESLFVRQTKS